MGRERSACAPSRCYDRCLPCIVTVSEEIWHRNGGQDADDRHDDHQLNKRETFITCHTASDLADHFVSSFTIDTVLNVAQEKSKVHANFINI
jgi:hypothetical protein